MSKSRATPSSRGPSSTRYGADATRWYMYAASPAGSSRRFSAGLVEEGLRRLPAHALEHVLVLRELRQHRWLRPRAWRRAEPAAEIDRWLLSELNALVLKVTAELDAYDPTDAARAIEAFVDDLSNWYVRR